MLVAFIRNFRELFFLLLLLFNFFLKYSSLFFWLTYRFTYQGTFIFLNNCFTWNLIFKISIWCINLIRFLFFFFFLRNLILRSFITWQRSLARLVFWMRNIGRLPFHLRNVHILHWRLKKWTLILHDNIVDSTGCDTANNIIDCTHSTNLTKRLSSRPSETSQISNNYISLCSWDQRRWCRRNINLVWTYHSRLLNISLPRSSTSSWLYYRLPT
jgi:hypothetical protein